MGVYSRDNVDYQGMIQNMLANRARGAQIRSQGINRQGEIWGNAVSNIGNIASSTIRDMAAQEEAAKQQELENSWKQQQIDFQNRQLAQQKDLQLQQIALSRELAGQQKAEAAAANQDENMKNWNIANARMRYAWDELKKDPGNSKLQEQYDDAMFNEQYWRKKADVQIPQPAPQEAPAPEQPQHSNADLRAQFDEAAAGEYTDESAAKLDAIIKEAEHDETLRAELSAKKKKMGLTKEGKQAAAATALKNAQESFSKMNTLQKRQFLKDNPQYTANGGKLSFAKKK